MRLPICGTCVIKSRASTAKSVLEPVSQTIVHKPLAAVARTRNVSLNPLGCAKRVTLTALDMLASESTRERCSEDWKGRSHQEQNVRLMYGHSNPHRISSKEDWFVGVALWASAVPFPSSATGCPDFYDAGRIMAYYQWAG